MILKRDKSVQISQKAEIVINLTRCAVSTDNIIILS